MKAPGNVIPYWHVHLLLPTYSRLHCCLLHNNLKLGPDSFLMTPAFVQYTNRSWADDVH